jgi:hypothetical protein
MPYVDIPEPHPQRRPPPGAGIEPTTENPLGDEDEIPEVDEEEQLPTFPRSRRVFLCFTRHATKQGFARCSLAGVCYVQ